jgi:glutathione S-transferase
MNKHSGIHLFGRRGSHFTRVAAIAAIELGIDYQFHQINDLASLSAEDYGGHPALKLPTLHVDNSLVFGTDNICRKLNEISSTKTPKVIQCDEISETRHRNGQELIWHAMSVQVQLYMGSRIAKLPQENIYFLKLQQSLLGALQWVETDLNGIISAIPSPRNVSIFEISLFCLFKHLIYRPTIKIDSLTKIARFADDFSQRRSAKMTEYPQ